MHFRLRNDFFKYCLFNSFSCLYVHYRIYIVKWGGSTRSVLNCIGIPSKFDYVNLVFENFSY